MSKKKVITLLLTLAMILSLSVGVSAAETTEAKVPITLTVVNTVTQISCTVPACLPGSLVDGYVVTANHAMTTNTGKNGGNGQVGTDGGIERYLFHGEERFPAYGYQT